MDCFQLIITMKKTCTNFSLFQSTSCQPNSSSLHRRKSWNLSWNEWKKHVQDINLRSTLCFFWSPFYISDVLQRLIGAQKMDLNALLLTMERMEKWKFVILNAFPASKHVQAQWLLNWWNIPSGIWMNQLLVVVVFLFYISPLLLASHIPSSTNSHSN